MVQLKVGEAVKDGAAKVGEVVKMVQPRQEKRLRRVQPRQEKPSEEHAGQRNSHPEKGDKEQ